MYLHLFLALPNSNNVPFTGRMPELGGHVLMEGLSAIARPVRHFELVFLKNNLFLPVSLVFFSLSDVKLSHSIFSHFGSMNRKRKNDVIYAKFT